MYSLSDALKVNIENKNVLIIGCPASGKTFLMQQFKSSHKQYATDDYMSHGYKESMYVLLSELVESLYKTMVEGVQGYRLLRKGVELDNYYPDIVFQLIISEEQMLRTYRNERNDKKVKYLKGFNKMHDKILSDYFAMANSRKPEWIKVDNTY